MCTESKCSFFLALGLPTNEHRHSQVYNRLKHNERNVLGFFYFRSYAYGRLHGNVVTAQSEVDVFAMHAAEPVT